MALVLKDRVKETTATTGTGAVTLAGAVTGFQPFSVIGDGNTTYYAIVDSGFGSWEVGIGTYTASGTTLSRDAVLESSNSGSLVSFAAGNKDVFVTYPAEVAVTTDGLQTLINKRIDPRVFSTASASSVTPDVSLYDAYAFTALAAGLTINAPTGTPVNGNKLIFRILDDGTTRTLTWNATYTVIGVTLPTATTANKTSYVGCIYNAANTRWDVVAVTTEA
jgi:hypothetical protein